MNKSKPSYSVIGKNGKPTDDYGFPRYDIDYQHWRDQDGFAIGYSCGPQVLAETGYANNSVGIELQAARPGDYASIRVSLGNVLNLNAWANSGAAGTLTSTASAEGSLTITGGKLTGSYTATMSIDASAYIAAYKANVQIHITDTFKLTLCGTGYVGGAITMTAESGSSLVATAPPAASTGKSSGGTFDLARFAASVLNTGQSQIAFMASGPGESIHGVGTSTVTMCATAELLGGARPEVLRFYDVDRSCMVFNESSTPAGGHFMGIQGWAPNSISLFHHG